MSCNKKWLSPVNILRNPDIFYPCLHQVKALLRMEMVTTKLHQTNCFPIPLWKWEIRILHGSKPKKSVAKTFAFDQTRERKDICRIYGKMTDCKILFFRLMSCDPSDRNWRRDTALFWRRSMHWPVAWRNRRNEFSCWKNQKGMLNKL